MLTLEDVWPLFRLRLVTPRLVLRPLRDQDIPAYIEAAASGVHDAPTGRTPFLAPWDESPDLVANTPRWIWETRLRSRPEAWTVAFGVWSHDGGFLGSQDVRAEAFGDLRTVGSGSWLRRSAHGQGLGTEMRAAVLFWAFDWLGAEYALTSAFDWNAPSLGVSRRLGYGPNGESRLVTRPGVVERELHLRLAKADFKRPGWELTVDGAEAAAASLGIHGERGGRSR